MAPPTHTRSLGDHMRVFISCSKTRSGRLAIALRDWLPDVIQEVLPLVSSEDIDKGQRWSTEVGANLNETRQGIHALTVFYLMSRPPLLGPSYTTSKWTQPT